MNKLLIKYKYQQANNLKIRLLKKMKKKILIIAILSIAFIIAGFYSNYFYLPFVSKFAIYFNSQEASLAAIVKSPFNYDFKVDGVLEETGKIDDSSSPYFWLNSGGQFILKDGIGKTIQGDLSFLSKWQMAYNLSNPVDTDSGYHPQNIFRLLTRSKWKNMSQGIYFKINKVNFSKSIERNAWSGALLFNRYQDGNNLYYTGIRMDGRVVIKKKTGGVYYTLAEKVFYNADAQYNRDTNPNFIPGQKWIGLKSEIITNLDNTVSIKLFIDKDKTGNWILAAEAKDDGTTSGGAVILNEGYAGIRTDFMDIEFDDYILKNI